MYAFPFLSHIACRDAEIWMAFGLYLAIEIRIYVLLLAFTMADWDSDCARSTLKMSKLTYTLDMR
jgi:hypothetical protein